MPTILKRAATKMLANIKSKNIPKCVTLTQKVGLIFTKLKTLENTKVQECNWKPQILLTKQQQIVLENGFCLIYTNREIQGHNNKGPS